MNILQQQKEDEKIDDNVPVYIGDLSRILQKVQTNYDVE